MGTFKALMLGGAMLVASVLTGQAADLYGGAGSLKDSYVPVAYSGCAGWYGRVDGGYATFDRPSGTEIGVDDYVRPSLDDTWTVGGGIGRYFTCNVRADLTVDHRFASKFRGTNDNPFAPVFGTHRFDYDSTAILANVYYDFDLRSRFTPYVGVGFGLVRNQIGGGRGVTADSVGTGGAGIPITIAGNDQWQVAGALMTGFSMALRDQLKLDAGYRFMYLGEARTGQITNSANGGTGGPSRIEDLHSHEFRVGLRYDFK